MEPSGNAIAAEVELCVRDDDGSREPLTLRLFVPERSAKAESWQCEYQLTGFRNSRQTIHGVDSWQALFLAISIVKSELSSLSSWLFYLDEAVDLKSLFGVTQAG